MSKVQKQTAAVALVVISLITFGAHLFSGSRPTSCRILDLKKFTGLEFAKFATANGMSGFRSHTVKVNPSSGEMTVTGIVGQTNVALALAKNSCRVIPIPSPITFFDDDLNIVAWEDIKNSKVNFSTGISMPVSNSS